jgi:hypothetical protein
MTIRKLLSALAAVVFFLPVHAQNTLDQLGLSASTPAVGAYSIRKLSSSYTGPALRIRRDTDNSEQDIPFLPSGDLDTTVLKSFVGSANGLVRTWYDQSGLNNHISQATPANQPRLLASGTILREQGRPSIEFTNAAVSFLSTTSAVGVAGQINTSMFMVTRFTNGGSTGDIPFALGQGGSNTRTRTFYRISNSVNWGYVTWGNDINNSTISLDLQGGTHVFNTVQTGQSVSFSRDGNLVSQNLPSAPTTILSPIISVGTLQNNQAGFATDMNTGEVLAFVSALSSADRQAVECSQIGYFNIINSAGADVYTRAVPVATSCQYAEESVFWRSSDLVNTSVTGNSLRRVAGTSNWDAAGYSWNTVADAGYFEFTASETNTARMAGVSNTNTNSSFNSIQYAFYLRSDGLIEIYESGSSRGSYGTYITGDRFRIAIENGRVKYYRNGVLIYHSNILPSLPMFVDASLFHPNATITSPVVGNLSDGSYTVSVSGAISATYQWLLNGAPVATGSAYSNPSLLPGDQLTVTATYSDACGISNANSNTVRVVAANQANSINFYITGLASTVGCTISEEDVNWDRTSFNFLRLQGNSLIKMQSGGWDGGAVSINSVQNEGSLSFVTQENNRSKMVGLSQASTSNSYTDIQYAVYLRSDGIAEIYESGIARFNLGAYAVGDQFRIAVEGGVVKYYRNGNLVYISTQVPTLPMIVDVSLQNVGGSISDLKISNYSQGSFQAVINGAVSNPTYQWYVNGNPVGSGTAVYTNGNLAPNDVVTCVVTPNINGCSTTSYTSNPITIKQIASAGIDFGIISVASIAGCTVSEEQVSWLRSTLRNVSASGNNLVKIQSGGAWTGGAESINKVYNEGYLVFKGGETNRWKMIGLSNTNQDSSFTTIQYAIYLRADGVIEIYESGVSRGTYGNYSASDDFKIAVEGGVIKYYRNNNLFYISGQAPILPLIVDVSINSTGGTVTDARIFNYSQGVYQAIVSSNVPTPTYQWYLNGNPVGSNNATYVNGAIGVDDVVTCVLTPNLYGCSAVSYTSNPIVNRQVPSAGIDFGIVSVATNVSCAIVEEQVMWERASLRNVNTSANDLVKIQNNGVWSGGAASINRVYNEGFMTFRVAETNTFRMIGLSNQNLDSNFTTIQYAVYLRNDGAFEVRESGVSRGTIGNYGVNDEFKIAVEGGVVKYYRNNNLFYISTLAPTLPMLVDVSIYNTNATVRDVRVSNFSQGSFQALVNGNIPSPSYQWFVNGNPVGSNSATYVNGNLNQNDVVTCVLTPNIAGCNSISYTSNAVTNKQVEPVGVDFLITATAANASCAVAEEQVSWERASLGNVNAQGNNLNKIQSNNLWDGAAVSLNRVYNEGYFVFTATETNRFRAVGLSSTNGGPSQTTIQYAFYLRNDASYEIYESGVSRGNMGGYANGDQFRVAVEGGRVKYYRNNILVFNSTLTPTLPMMVDVSIYNTGGTVSNARVFNYSQGIYTATVSSNVTSPVYQWMLNGVPVGTNSPTYTNGSLAPDDQLTCILTPNLNGCNLVSITSNVITNRQVPPVGIDFTITATPATTGCIVVEEQVSWERASLNNLNVNGSNLNKIQSNGNWDGGAASINRVSGEGFFTFVASEINRARVVGLSNVNVNAAANTVQYAFNLRNDGNFEIWESGVGRGNFGGYVINDEFKISVEGGVVRYFRNNNLVYISTIAPTLPLLVDVSINGTGGTVTNPRITNFSQGTYTAIVSSNVTSPVFQWFLNGSPVGTNTATYTNNALTNNDVVTCVLTPNINGCNLTTYPSNSIVHRQTPQAQTIDFLITSGSTSAACKEAVEEVVWRKADLVNTSATGNDLVKIQSGGSWNGGAASMNLVDNNGYFQFTATQINTARMAGLSNANANSNFTTIQYAIFLRSDGFVEVYESGIARGGFGAYAPGDVFKVSVDNGVVRYSRNGAIFYSSTIAPTLPMMADVSVNTVNGRIDDAVIANNSNTGLFTATVTNAGLNPTITWRVNGSVVQSGIGTTYINPSLNAGDVVVAELSPTLNGCSASVFPSNSVLINGPGATTNWTGAVSTDWFNGSNWTAGVPNRFRSAVVPSGTPNSVIVTAAADVYSLTINTGATVTISGSNQLFVYSTFTNNGTFTANQSRVIFTTCGNNGFAVAGSGTTTFYNLTINNPGGVTMSNGTFQVSNNMTFTNGIVQQNGTLVLLNGATVTGASNQSHVNGIVHKTGNQAFTFPVGKGGVYRPITMSAPSVATAQFAAEYFNAPQNLGFTYQAPINHVSGCEYWSLNRTIGSSNVSVTLNWNQALCPIYNIPMVLNMRVAHWTGTVWADRGATGITGNSAAGTVTSSPAVSQFGFFTLGTNTALNVLPIQLTTFTAELQGNLVDLKWETSSEQNCDYYTVERSTDNTNFTSIGRVEGNGTTNLVSKYGLQDRNINGLTRAYYRLKQTDLDGRTQYSKTILVKFEQTTAGFSVYPSPNNGVFNLKGNLQKVKQMQLLNLSGVVVRRLPLQTQHSLSDLKPGMYILQIIGDGFTEHVRFVKY